MKRCIIFLLGFSPMFFGLFFSMDCRATAVHVLFNILMFLFWLWLSYYSIRLLTNWKEALLLLNLPAILLGIASLASYNQAIWLMTDLLLAPFHHIFHPLNPHCLETYWHAIPIMCGITWLASTLPKKTKV